MATQPDTTAKFTPGPWQVFEANEHHGWYVTSDFGNTICDLYTMSRLDLPSTSNGGISHPVPFMHEMDEPNARLIAAAPELLAALLAIIADCGEAGMDGYVENSIHSDEVKAAKAVIARATGAA